METTLGEPEGAGKFRSSAGGSTATASQLELSRKIEALTALTPAQLRTEWRRLYRCQPPRLSRDLLIRGIAYRVQELAYGGLSKATQRKLTALTSEWQKNGSIVPDSSLKARRGTRLVREWRGKTYTVVITDDGFEYHGKIYSSLSKIAQAITGAHWSGPRFFGLNRVDGAGAQSGAITSGAIGEDDFANG